MTDLWQRSALGIAAAIRRGDTSSREVLDVLVALVEQVNGQLNAIVVMLGDEAEKAADAVARAELPR
ncbi:hypothetical protein BH18ACT2_BH18ACT2_11080 [soil metagenome]